MPLVTIINTIGNLDSDSETDALSASMGKLLRVWLEMERAERKAADEKERFERERDMAALWARVNSIHFDDVHGTLEGERVWASGYRQKTEAGS